MKKKSLFLILILGLVFVLMAQKQEEKKYDIRTAYVYQKATLLVSETDLNCSYFIKKEMSEDIRVIGGDQMDYGKQDYSDGDRVFVNKGSTDGIHEGDIFLVFTKGQDVNNKLNSKSLGTLYLKKSLGEVTCLYENRAEVTLQKGCYPVRIGDFLIPYKPQKTIFKQKPIYTRCKLPQNRTEGNVVYSSMYMETERVMAGPQEYVTIDLGIAMVSKGDFLLFYKILRRDLPPIIIGTGIVVDSQNTNSTVKVLDAGFPVSVGVKLLVLKPEDLTYETRKSKMRRLTGEEKIPIIEKLDKEEGGPVEGEQTLELNILFDINEHVIKDEYKADLEKIVEFLQGKSEFAIILRGYSCSIGNEEYNLRLSKMRVDNLKQYLMQTFNFKEDFFEAYHYGEKESPFDNTSEEERRKNRLVTIQVIAR